MKCKRILSVVVCILVLGHFSLSAGTKAKHVILIGKGVKRILEFKESMMQFDIAATIAYIFDLSTPQVWVGRPMKQLFK